MSTPWDDEFERLLRGVLPQLAAQRLTPFTCLPDAGLDSMATIEILLKLEDTYGVTFPDGSLSSGTFASPGALWAALSEVRAGASAVQ
jgi:acyl carrier protein